MTAGLPILPVLLLLLLLLAPASADGLTTIATSNVSVFASGFSFPLLAPGSTVVFDGYDSAGSGIYSAAAGQKQQHTAKIVSTSSSEFTSLASAATSAGGTVFLGTGNGSSMGVYFAAHDQPGNLVPVVVTGGEQGFTSVSNPSVDAENHIAFEGKVGNSSGLYFVAHPSARPKLVVDSSAKFPDGKGRLCFEFPSVISQGTGVVFFSSNCGSHEATLRNRNRMCRSRRSVDHAIQDEALNLDAGIFFTTSGGSEKVSTIADFQTPPPDAVNGNETFVAFSRPVPGEEYIAFIGETTDRLGIFAYHIETGKLVVVADTYHTLVPGVTGKTHFGDFPNPPSVSGTKIAFYAEAPEALSGVYMLDVAEAKLEPVVTMIDNPGKAGGGALTYLGFGANAFDGEKIAFYAVTSIDGIFVADVPSSNAATN